MIKFSVALLEKQDIDLEGTEPAEFLELGEENFFRLPNPVRYRLRVSKVSGGALVTGSVATEVEGECGRCLTPVAETVTNADIHLFYELTTEQELDITEDVRTEMVIELPMNLLCSEDCTGLCPGCGVNLNIGKCRCKPEAPDSPAWGALDGLNLK